MISSAIPALWFAALAIKLLAWYFAPEQILLDRGINFAIIVLAALSIYRVTRLARSGLLWGVSRKLILSYLLVGAVPILLLATFSLVAFLLVFFDVSSYLVHNRIAELTEQTATLARTTLADIESSASARHEAIASRREATAAPHYPGVEIVVVGAETLPAWVPSRGFAGLIDQGQIARGVAVSSAGAPRHAVIVDIPVDGAMRTAGLADAGVRLGERAASFFRTATFFSYVDWPSGTAARTRIDMGVDVLALYRWLASSSSRQPTLGAAGDGPENPNFNRVLFYMLIGVGMLLLVIEAVALGNGVALARTITSAVDELFSGTARVKAGNFSTQIAVRSDDQLGQLAASFNDMTERIQALLREQNEKRRLEEELRIARDIQMSLLPQEPLAVPGISLAALCAPAREVGGDYYDFLPLPDGRVGLLIADVAGKGTSAALYMAELKGLMLSLSRIHTSPRALLVDANQIISRHLDSRSFITMTYALVDPAARTLTCARAGHTPFMRIRTSAAGAARAEVLVPEGMVLGLNLDRGERFERCLEELTIPLEPHDMFFFFTDGVSEAMDGAGECYGELRLAAYLESHAAGEPAEIRDGLLQELTTFVGGQAQHDDITMVILKVG